MDALLPFCCVLLTAGAVGIGVLVVDGVRCIAKQDGRIGVDQARRSDSESHG